MPRTRPPTAPPDPREQELVRLRERVAELERALAEPAGAALALQETETRFKALVASVPGAVYLCEIKAPWKDTYMSSGVYAITGYRAADLLRPDGITINDLTLPEDLETVDRQLEEAVFSGQPFELRYRIRHADGSVRWVYDRGQATYAADGTPLFLGGVILDITDRMVADEALRESEARYRTLVSSVPGAVFLCGSQFPWTSTFMSKGVELLTGHPQAAFTGPGGNFFTEITSPEDTEALVATTERAIARGEPWAARYRIRHADGGIRWVYEHGRAAYGPHSRPLFLSGVILDITDRVAAEESLRESEQRFRTLVDNVPGAVYRCEIHPPYRDLYVSDGILEITGYPASDYLREDGPRFGNMAFEEDRERIAAAVDAAVSSRTTFDIRYRIRHADGGSRWVQEQGRATFSENGAPLYLDGVLMDITGEVALEQGLREREERLRTIVENEPECVKLVDRDGNLLEMNPAGLGMIEADSLAQVHGRCLCPMIAPPDEPAFREMIAAVFEGQSRKLVFELIGLRGTHRILETHSVPLWDGPERREVRALLGVTRDITARMQLEQAQEASETRYRTLVATVPGAVYLCEVAPPWRDSVMSDGVQAITGYAPEEFLRENGLTINDITLEQDRPKAASELATAVARRGAYASRYRIRHADGTIRWVHDQGRAACDEQGQPLFLTGVIVDITDRMAAEEAAEESRSRLVEAQRIAQVGSWDFDFITGKLSWSEAHYRILELDPTKLGATYERFLALVHPDDRARVDQAYTESVKKRMPYELVHRLLMPDGRVKYVHERAETRYDPNGNPIRSLGTVQDITDRRQAEQVRQGLEAQLRQSQKMEAIGTLAGGIAHDFNNILAAVIGHAELLAEDVGADQAGQEGIKGILEASRRARDLVQQILTFSRLREQERGLIPLEPVVREVLKLLRATLPSTIEIRTTVTTEDHLVLADATQMHQVVLNLCTNAAHAMQEHGGVLDVSYQPVRLDAEQAQLHPGLQPGLYMRLVVRDTGHGMDQLTLERIFDPFFTTKSPGEGTGLGLAVVHGIVQSHEGSITATSEPGEGTAFQVFFPAVEGRSTAVATEDTAMRLGSGEHILVVDDEPSLVRIANRLLERLGYRVTAHTHPTEALADFLKRPDDFDLVLSDLTMPQMTGLDLASRLLARRPDLPILLTSGYAGALDPAELRRVGVRELVGKPFLTRTLADAVARALHRR